PIKKNDIFGIHKNNSYEWEVLLGEVSNGPFINTTQTQLHISDDHNKLGKCAKDALDDALNYFINLNCSAKTQNLKTFKEINTFLIYAHEIKTLSITFKLHGYLKDIPKSIKCYDITHTEILLEENLVVYS
ncbi:6744_t:CDS:2, partial [Racocetra fulgida]